MGYRGSDRRYGEGWRDRDDRYDRGGYGRGNYAQGDDRGFFDRAGDEVRSWFGDEEAERRREMDERRWERERAMTGRRERGESWHRDRPGEFGAGTAWRGGGEEIFGDFPDYGRRFDRIDPGSVGTFGAGYGATAFGFGSSARAGGLHDPHYSEWRSRQIEELDRDYDEFRREHQSRFEREFGDWRTKRQGQRQLLGKVIEHMEVAGSDGILVGTVDKVRGDRIILTKGSDEAGGVHRSIPCAWVESVEEKVILNRGAEDARSEWRNEESSRAFFERDERSGEGPHMLNRSFAGTYGGRNG